MNHIQWLSLRPATSSAQISAKTPSWASAKRCRLNGSLIEPPAAGMPPPRAQSGGLCTRRKATDAWSIWKDVQLVTLKHEDHLLSRGETLCSARSMAASVSQVS